MNQPHPELLCVHTRRRLAAAELEQVYENLQIIAHGKTHRKVLEIFAQFPAPRQPSGGARRRRRPGVAASQARLQVTAGDIDPHVFQGGPDPVHPNRPEPALSARRRAIPIRQLHRRDRAPAGSVSVRARVPPRARARRLSRPLDAEYPEPGVPAEVLAFRLLFAGAHAR